MNLIAEAILLIMPSYIANSSAVLLKGKKPIDFGKKWRGKPIFGEGKTWRGFIGGITAGIIAGIIINSVWHVFGSGFFSIAIISSLSFGAMLGDLLKSFFKRRLGKERGEKWLIFDQVDFLLGAFLLCLFISHILFKLGYANKNWFLSKFTIYHIIFLLIFTPLLHLATNIIAYLLKLKKVPW